MPTETYPIWTMLSHHRRGAASPRYRNRAKITVFMCQQKPFPVRFSCPRKSCDPYDSVNRLSYRKCRHYWPTGIFSPTGELGRRTTNRYLYRTFFIFKRHGHNFLPSNLSFIDDIFNRNQPTRKWNSRGESICVQLFLLQFYILTFHVRIFTLEIKEAGTQWKL